ncbi:hypothetical protein [Halobellus ruber]|uniref:Uncharacterized protein n=1 Tax=Halobellus ruber TaxID=2761102 RepID=A0A7J9SF35_9EURY|nr:hypothetical protein [Halobellus ruber]MBB6645574.1 hypothetical protein [Halobellus ruber]
MIVPELGACPNCGTTDVCCCSNGLDVIGGNTEKYCHVRETTVDLGEAVYG